MMRRPIIGRGGHLTFAAGIVFDNTLNLVIDGNSMIYGIGGAQNITRILAKTAPIAVTTIPITQSGDATPLAGSPTYKWQSTKGVILTHFGVSGQTWRQMNGLDGGSAADVDGAYDTNKAQNYLITYEATNALTVAHRTVAQTIQDATDYATARRAAHPWKKIFAGTQPPRMNSSTNQSIVDADNLVLDQYNAYLLAHYKEMGFDGVFDVRQAGSPFNLPDYLIATFNAAAAAPNTVWSTGDTGHVHPSSTGYDYIVKQCIMPMLTAA